MARSEPERTNSLSEKYVKAPNLIERAKEEIEAIIHTEKSRHHHKETHGTSNDIDENTPIDEVKAPNVFERAKEEIEALVEAIHLKKESESHNSSLNKQGMHTEKSPHHHKETHGTSDDIDENTPIDEVKAPNVFERAKEEIEALIEAIHPKKESESHNSSMNKWGMHTEKSPHHHKETHGTSDDIDENTPIDEVKAPNVFERAKEEIEALVEAIHPKKESESHNSSPKKREGGFFASIGRRFEKICYPWDKKQS